MPEMDGSAAARQLRVLDRSVKQPKIIAHTGERDPSPRERCLAAGMEDYLVKPISQVAPEKSLERAS